MDLITTGVVHDGTSIVERRSQDVAPILDHVSRLRNAGEVGSSEMRYAARFPKAAVEQYLQTYGIDLHEWMTNPVHVKRMLNDPDLTGFRIWKGRI